MNFKPVFAARRHFGDVLAEVVERSVDDASARREVARLHVHVVASAVGSTATSVARDLPEHESAIIVLCDSDLAGACVVVLVIVKSLTAFSFPFHFRK